MSTADTRSAELATLLPPDARLFLGGKAGNARELFGQGFSEEKTMHLAHAPEARLHIPLEHIDQEVNLAFCLQSDRPLYALFIWNGRLVRRPWLHGGMERLEIRINRHFLHRRNTLCLRLQQPTPAGEIFLRLAYFTVEYGVSPREHALRRFRQSNGRFPSDALTGFNDIIFRRKMDLWDQDLSLYADKIAVREYVARNVGSKYLVPLQGVYDSPEAIRPEQLHYPCVIKSNHASGHFLFLNEPVVSLDCDLLRDWLVTDWFLLYGEPCYRGITPRLFVEDRINSDDQALYDYKFHCFGGKVKSIAVISDRSLTEKPMMIHYNEKWEKQEFSIENLLYHGDMEKPENLAELIEISEELAKIFKYIRVDLYNHNNKIIFGELTFFHYGAHGKNTSAYWDAWLAEQYRNVMHLPLI